MWRAEIILTFNSARDIIRLVYQQRPSTVLLHSNSWLALSFRHVLVSYRATIVYKKSNWQITENFLEGKKESLLIVISGAIKQLLYEKLYICCGIISTY